VAPHECARSTKAEASEASSFELWRLISREVKRGCPMTLVSLSRIERLLLFNQYRILEVLVPDLTDTYRMYQEILENGFEFEYDEILKNIYKETLSEEDSKQIIKVLVMYQALRRSGLPEEETTFGGYDGNNETDFMSYVDFLYLAQGKFRDVIPSRDRINSHTPMKDAYRRMLAKWREYREDRELTKEHAQEILDARRAPR
jgi:uncharacterized protein YfbU (UPF0304 family)